MGAKVLKVDDRDNVLVALADLAQGTSVNYHEQQYTLLEDIPAKHKFFAHDMIAGEEVTMYGILVGKVQFPVRAGSRMTVENTKHAAEPYQYRKSNFRWRAPDVSQFKRKFFLGYHRNDGTVGTANYWLFIPTVFCENRNLDIIKEALYKELGYAVGDKYKNYTHALLQTYQNGGDLEQIDLQPVLSHVDRAFKNIDGIKFLNHSGGCGGTRHDANTLSKLLAAYANHPNVAGVTVLSLGCEHLQAKQFKTDLLALSPNFKKPLIFLGQQQVMNEEELIKETLKETFKGLTEINKIERRPAPLSKLCVGVKCGGSDGFSGISANPAVGHCADLLVALGAKVLSAEFPELCGVEQQLIDRMPTEETARKFIKLMTEYDELAHKVGSGFYMNPSPGNIKDGLITDAIKSAGAAKKAGTSPVVDVLDYTELATKAGLSLVCTPGNDVEATTGKAAAGATLILFTTGLGTPTGNPVCPTIKVATNTSLATRMADIIDVDAGAIIAGKKTIAEMGEDILNYCIEVASGREIPKAVQLNQDDFIPWKRGVSL
jgi:altronate hydrolase